VGAAIVFVFFFAAFTADVISPYPYYKTNVTRPNYAAPGKYPEHILGTDEIGRDILSRVIYGARTSAIVAIAATAFTVAVSLTLGLIAGWLGGWPDYIINRAIEIVGALPGLLFQIMLIQLIGTGVLQVTFVIAILAWPQTTRLVRAQVIAWKERDFVDASRSLGANELWVALRHVLPNTVNPLIVAITFAIPGFIAAEAGLSFLGYGITEPTPSWGKMVGVAGQYLQAYSHMALIPVACLALIILGFAFLGDALRDALDPRSDQV
jgi:oligopeptide transport system permease protein